MHRLNIIISKTDTIMGKSIRLIMGGNYNHCSISFDDDLTTAYSFSRGIKYLWFTGCFCEESFDLYSDYIVYQIVINDTEYKCIRGFIEELSERFRIYNYLGAIGSVIGVAVPFKYNYICSTFVARVLNMVTKINLSKNLYKYSPMDVYNLLESYNFTVLRKNNYIGLKGVI